MQAYTNNSANSLVVTSRTQQIDKWILIAIIVAFVVVLAVLATVIGCLCRCCCHRKKGRDVESQRRTSSKPKKQRRSKSTHNQAAKRSTRSKAGVTSGRGKLDLHGYTKSGAMARLKTFLRDSVKGYRNSNYNDSKKSVEVVTGRGLHSAGGVPVIKPEVEKYLKTNNYANNWSNPGMVKIDLGN